MKSLYQLITELVEKRRTIYKTLMLCSEESKKGLRKRTNDRYKKITKEIQDVEDEYFIGIEDLGKILSSYTGEEYMAKIFREINPPSYKKRYTGRFVACYIDESNPYHSRQEAQIDLNQDDFGALTNRLYLTKALVFSHNGQLECSPLALGNAFKNTNFIRVFTEGNNCNSEICGSFMRRVEPMLKRELESANIIANDDSFDQSF